MQQQHIILTLHSCVDEVLKDPFNIWSNLLSHNPVISQLLTTFYRKYQSLHMAYKLEPFTDEKLFPSP